VTICERLPAAPAVYAWFRTLRLQPNLDPETFAARLESLVAARAAPDHSARLGPMHGVTLEARSDLSSRKSLDLHRLATSEVFRTYVATVVEKASLLQAPLYVGKAQHLQRRIRQHLDPASDLATRLREIDIRLDECVLAYVIVEAADPHIEGESLTLLEEIITRICRPGFVLRPG
jgi:hypothetical protein